MSTITKGANNTSHEPGNEQSNAKTIERVTVALTTRVSSDLDRLQQMTGLSKTDLVNRALSLYHLAQKELDAGHELAFYDPEAEEFRRVHIA